MTFDQIDHLAIDFVRHVFRFVDEQRSILNELIERDMKQGGDSPLFPYSDYFAGMGFVAGQRYINSVCGLFRVDKEPALAMGAEVVPGVTYARLINATANYWKHSDEWDFENPEPQQLATLKLIEKVGVSVGANTTVAANVFHRLGLLSFSQLLPILKTWSDVVSTFD